MEELFQELLLNKGTCLPCAYDTAWVALVTKIDGTLEFPECLEWMRKNQLCDGSWGTDLPMSPHANTLSTLIAIIALSHANDKKDFISIDNGINALWKLSELLHDEIHIGAGFEIILPSLLNHLRKYNLYDKVPHDIYARYLDDGLKKLAYVRKDKSGKPATWWFSAEMFYPEDIDLSPVVIDENRSAIALSPSATAYKLIKLREKGEIGQEYVNYLRSIIIDGGVPDHSPIDIFELSFSLDFLYQSGAKIPRELYIKLENMWSDSGVGFSKHWKMPDADDTATILSVLPSKPLEPLLKFYNTKSGCFEGYPGERSHSVSVNVNALKTLTLRNFEGKETYIESINTWLEDKLLTPDKWNVSKFYVPSRAVFSVKEELAQKCIDFLITNQNDDGGWGISMEESAYVVLALCYWYKSGYASNLLEIVSNAIIKAKIYFETHEMKMVPLWCAKVLYCPYLIAKCAIYSAKHILMNTYYMIYVNIKGEQEFNGKLFTFFPRSERPNIELSNVKKYFGDKIGQKYDSDDALDSLVYTMYKNHMNDEDKITESKLYLVVFMYDVIIDKGFSKMKEKSDLVMKAFDVFIAILCGQNQNVVHMKEFDKFDFICHLLTEIRAELASKNIDMELFEYGVIQYHKAYVQKFLNRVNNVILNADDHLKIASMTFAVPMFCGMHLIFAGEKQSDHVVMKEYQECAFKLGRLIGDLFSFMKDLAKVESNLDNYVLVRHFVDGETLDQAFMITCDLCLGFVVKMTDLEKQLDNKVIVTIFKNMIQGITDWSSTTKRYAVNCQIQTEQTIIIF